MAGEVYRPRVLAEPVDEIDDPLRQRSRGAAHRLLGDGAAGEGDVAITQFHEIAGEGTEIHGDITDRSAQRSYQPTLPSTSRAARRTRRARARRINGPACARGRAST